MKASGRTFKPKPSQAKKEVKQIARTEAKKVLSDQTELKFHHVDIGPVRVGNSTSSTNDYLITQLAQGNTDSTRNGDKIVLKKFHVAATLQAPDTAVDSAMRLIIFRSKQRYNATQPVAAWNDVINGNYTTTAQSVNAPRNMDTKASYTVLYDKVFTFRGGTDSSATKPIQLDITHKMNSKINFEGASANYAEGHIYIMARSNNTNATAADQPLLTFLATAFYTDN